MSQGSLLSGPEDASSLERLPASGMTRGLELFELPPLVLPTSETDGSVLLPTPTVEQGRNETSGRPVDSQHHPGVTLQDVAYKMAGRGESTPQPSDAGNKSSEEQHLTLW